MTRPQRAAILEHNRLTRTLFLGGLLLSGGLPGPWATGLETNAPAVPRAFERPQRGRRWVPAHHELRTIREKIPGKRRRVWVPALYRTIRDRRGNPVQVLVRPGHFETFQSPPKTRTRRVMVLVPGHWVRV